MTQSSPVYINVLGDALLITWITKPFQRLKNTPVRENKTRILEFIYFALINPKIFQCYFFYSDRWIYILKFHFLWNLIKSLAEFWWNLILKSKVFPKTWSNFLGPVSVLHRHNMTSNNQKQGLLSCYDSRVYY